MREQLHGVDQLDAVGFLLFQSVSLDAESEDSAAALRQVLLRQRVAGVRLQVSVIDP